VTGRQLNAALPHARTRRNREFYERISREVVG
jgi:hypothetical protein